MRPVTVADGVSTLASHSMLFFFQTVSASMAFSRNLLVDIVPIMGADRLCNSFEFSNVM